MSTTKIIIDACCRIPHANKPGRSCRGKSACGVLIIDEKGNEHERSQYLGEMTPPQAEFNGLLFALDIGTEYTRGEIEIWMDSELVIKWMNGDYRLKKAHIKPLFDKAKQFEGRYKGVKYFHHGRESKFAKKADKIAQYEFKKHT